MFSLLAGISLLLFITDVLLKQHIEETIELDEEKELIPEKIVIRKVYNEGFMLHFLDKYPYLIKIITGVMGIGVAVYNVRLFMKKRHFAEKLGLSVFTAGAASNIFDRLVRGKVIDYIGFRSKNSFLSRLTVNLADVFIVVGAVILMLKSILGSIWKR